MRDKFSCRALLELGCYGLPALTFLSLWIPVVRHYYVPNPTITDGMLNAARWLPSDQVLEDLQAFYFFTPSRIHEAQLVETAQKLLKGEMDNLGFPGEKLGMPFDASDLDRLSGHWQLLLVNFAVPDILLDAYQVTGNEAFLSMARDVILGWALYERQAWLPGGYLWLDTAVAERILVLAKFWRFYRHHPAFDPEVAKIVLGLAVRSSRFLAKPTHYTFSSNHGIIQNLGLWHFCLAFPSLPHAEQYKQLALARMRDQMTFYLNEEGVILEHSAGYQKFGLQLIGMAFRYLSMLNLTSPEGWVQKYEQATAVYAHLRRPDSTLPMFGDTDGGQNPSGPPLVTPDMHGRAEGWQHESDWMPQQANSLYPVAGYSIWWNGLASWPAPERLTQTVVAWSHFPGHAHKHADEMSVLLWAGGQTWWTNVGYWAYDGLRRSRAISWDGSSAPHLLSEDARSARTTRLSAFGWSDDIAMIDLERDGPQRARFRRQVVYLQPNLWLVLDHFSGQGNARTTWTTAHNVSLSEGEIAGSYQLQANNIGSRLTTFILGSEGSQVKVMRGSLRPFAGWEVIGFKPQPASALVIEQPAQDAWSAVLWSWDNASAPRRHIAGKPYMADWKDADHWKIMLPIKPDFLEIRRDGTKVIAHQSSDGVSNLSLEITKAPDVTQKIRQIHSNYATTKDKYPKFRDKFESRLKITKILIVLFVLQELVFLVYRKAVKKSYLMVRLCNVVGWGTIGLWLNIAKFGI